MPTFHVKSTSPKEAPEWARECVSNPKNGVSRFLKELCALSGAPYAHIRVLSRFGKFYTMAESIGPYKYIGWRRRFHLIDRKDEGLLGYQFLDYEKSQDCIQLKKKFAPDSAEYQYLNSLVHGFWIPLSCDGIELGYVTLSWNKGIPGKSKATIIKKYINSVNRYVPLLFQACRSVIADRYLNNLWADSSIIFAATSEPLCYDRMAEACVKLWGSDATVYVGKFHANNNHIEVVSVAGLRSNEAKRNINRQNISYGKGIFSYALESDSPIISFSVSKDIRFEYHSMRFDGTSHGSAIAIRLCDESGGKPIAVISVEHELENYFDYDDVRYLTGISRIGYENVVAHRNATERISREFDTLFTQVSHDVVEPLQALVADAEVLKHEANSAMSYMYKEFDLEKYLTSTLTRATNFLETSLELNKIMWGHLDNGIDGAATRITDGRIRLYPLLNVLVDTWTERAQSQGIEIKPLFDSLKGVEVACDEASLKSSFGHLLGNAIKYSFWGRRKKQDGHPKFGRYINIVGRIKMGMAIVEFQNYGVGIRNSEASAIKDKFVRGELAIKEGRAGTGRGLWSANNFFESIGGYIVINSEPTSPDPNGPYFTSVFAHVPYVRSQEVQNG